MKKVVGKDFRKEADTGDVNNGTEATKKVGGWAGVEGQETGTSECSEGHLWELRSQNDSRSGVERNT